MLKRGLKTKNKAKKIKFGNYVIYERKWRMKMAKIKLWTTHKQNREYVLSCNGGISIGNDGVVNITLPKHLAIKLGFKVR